MCSCIRSVRDDHLIVYYDGKIMTKINDSYNNLKYGKYDGNRIFYKFNDEAEVQETYDDRIFNCTYKDETIQVRKSEDICSAINSDNLDDYAIVFKETYYAIHKIELITDLIKRSYGERVQLKNDDTFVVDDRLDLGYADGTERYHDVPLNKMIKLNRFNDLIPDNEPLYALTKQAILQSDESESLRILKLGLELGGWVKDV